MQLTIQCHKDLEGHYDRLAGQLRERHPGVETELKPSDQSETFVTYLGTEGEQAALVIEDFVKDIRAAKTDGRLAEFLMSRDVPEEGRR